jgi:hydrogenase maturation protease
MGGLMVIGIGNTMRRDDGVGILAVERLRTELADTDVDLEVITLDGESTRLVEAWTGADRVLVVDAVRSDEPAGSVRRLHVGDDPLPSAPATSSSHHSGLAAAVELGRALGRLPERLVLYGVEVDDVSHGEGLSPAVDAAMPDLVSALRAEVDR